MPTFEEYAAKVIKHLKMAGPRGATHDELRDIAVEHGWSIRTANRRAYHIETILAAVQAVEEFTAPARPSPMHIAASCVLDLLGKHSTVAMNDLYALEQFMAAEEGTKGPSRVEWRSVIDDCIEILTGLEVVRRKGENIALDKVGYKKLQRELGRVTVDIDK